MCACLTIETFCGNILYINLDFLMLEYINKKVENFEGEKYDV